MTTCFHWKADSRLDEREVSISTNDPYPGILLARVVQILQPELPLTKSNVRAHALRIALYQSKALGGKGVESTRDRIPSRRACPDKSPSGSWIKRNISRAMHADFRSLAKTDPSEVFRVELRRGRAPTLGSSWGFVYTALRCDVHPYVMRCVGERDC